MCGIIVRAQTIDKAPESYEKAANELALNAFEDQKERGMNGFGIMYIDEKRDITVSRATEAYKFMWDIHSRPTNFIIVHHRTPTSTPNMMDQTHPIFVGLPHHKHIYYVIHNGIISNADELKEEHEKKGVRYNTFMEEGKKFNDSESFAIELANAIECGNVGRLECEGSAAFVAIQLSKGNEKHPEPKVEKMFFGRSTYAALKMAQTRDKLWINSTGAGTEIKDSILYSCDVRDPSMKLRGIPMTFTLPTRTRSIYAGGVEVTRQAGASYQPPRWESGSSFNPAQKMLGSKTHEVGFDTKKGQDYEQPDTVSEAESIREDVDEFPGDEEMNAILSDAQFDAHSAIDDFLTDLAQESGADIEKTIRTIARTLQDTERLVTDHLADKERIQSLVAKDDEFGEHLDQPII